jgi:hypothetical protein
MSHFAEIDENNIVIRVLVVSDEQEHRGQEFLAEDLNLGGTWIQTSYNHNIRKQYAGIGYSYNSEADVFIRPRRFESWILDDNFDWQPPIQMPDDGKLYEWNEETISWIEIEMATPMQRWSDPE